MQYPNFNILEMSTAQAIYLSRGGRLFHRFETFNLLRGNLLKSVSLSMYALVSSPSSVDIGLSNAMLHCLRPPLRREFYRF
jgi:hypothetical protein